MDQMWDCKQEPMSGKDLLLKTWQESKILHMRCPFWLVIAQTNECWLHRALSRRCQYIHYEVAIITRMGDGWSDDWQMNMRLSGKRIWTAACLLASVALLPSIWHLSQKTEQWTNILCEMTKQDKGKTSFIPILGLLSTTFFPT